MTPDAGTRSGSRLLVPALAAVLAVPLVVGVLAVRRPTWYPVLDLAMTELRLRDVGGSHTPLIGLPGRIGSLSEQGSHPGPLSFYALAPVYKLLGSTSWAMQAAAAVLNIGALATSVWLAARRGGRPLALAVAALLSLLTLGYGVSPLTEPWNPYMPMLWWVVVLLGVWSVATGDLKVLPVVVGAASLCAQTHLPYLGLAGGITALLLLWVAVRARRMPAAERSPSVRWLVSSLALGAVLWLPPVLDQLSPPDGGSGNASLIVDSMLTPEDEPIGAGEAVVVTFRHLDVRNFLAPSSGGVDGGDGELIESSYGIAGIPWMGLLTFAGWLSAAGWTYRRRRDEPTLWSLHVVVATALVIGAVSISRIYGKLWYYLTLWSWGTALLLVLAIGLTAVQVVSPGLDDRRRGLLRRGGIAAGTAVLAVATAGFALAATDVPSPDDRLSAVLGALLPDTMAAIERSEGPAVGVDGRYRVFWTDAYYFGSQGHGLVSELERRGIDARAEQQWHVPVTRHRVLGAGEPADATVILATGIFVERWRDVPGVVEVAFVEPRDARQLAEYEQLHDEVLAGLQEHGLDDLVPLLEENLFAVSIDERLPGELLEARTERMLYLGQESAIFLGGPDADL